MLDLLIYLAAHVIHADDTSSKKFTEFIIYAPTHFILNTLTSRFVMNTMFSDRILARIL